MHMPYEILEEECNQLLIPVWNTLAINYVLSFVFLFGVHFLIYRPLNLITEAAKQYATGNLEYEIPIKTQVE